jgi:hypothetical protein
VIHISEDWRQYVKYQHNNADTQGMMKSRMIPGRR